MQLQEPGSPCQDSQGSHGPQAIHTTHNPEPQIPHTKAKIAMTATKEL